jgi:rod shape determining protein RodA
MRDQRGLFSDIDWVMTGIYLLLILMGWANIYAAVYNEEHASIFDMSQKYGKQLLWVVGSLIIAAAVMAIDGKFYAAFSYPTYFLFIVLLLVVYLIAPEVKGARSWIAIGDFKLQPSEFAKFATNMALAKYLSTLDIRIEKLQTKIISFVILFIPIGFIILQNDTGSALVFISFIFVLYREGLSGNILLLGFMALVLAVLALLVNKMILIGLVAGITAILLLLTKKTLGNISILTGSALLAVGLVFTVDLAFEKVLEPHQRTRINVLLGKETDLKGAGYNVNQSLIAIGSGGFAGKGYLNGTQTKYDFVPEQSTDFIFCTVGEEWGFLGSIAVLGLFTILLIRIIIVAERQRSDYSRIYGYGVASILFFHLLINIGMTIGLAPVIGIPLPFFSYGGSSLFSFTILLFIFIRLDAYRMMVLR